MALANIILGDTECIRAVEAPLLVYFIQIKRSRYEPWLGTLCCVLVQDTLLLLAMPLSAQVGAGKFNAGGNPVMDKHPIQGRVFTPSLFLLQKQEIH